MSLKYRFLILILLALCLAGCKKKKAERDSYAAALCSDMQEEGIENIEKGCKDCCEDAGAGYAFSMEAGCHCL